MRKVLTTIALVLGVSVFALTAHADEVGWTAVDTASGGDQSASALSAVSCGEALVTWAEGAEASAAGTSVENPDLGLKVDAGDTITVDYTMSDGAAPDGGSARLFVYYTAAADTWAVVPDQQAVADTSDGTLSITADGGTIGAVGVVYDTSGNKPGTVTYSGLTIAGEQVPFCVVKSPEPCEGDDEHAADDPECTEPDETTDEDVKDEDEQVDESTEDETTDETESTTADTTPATTQETLPDTGVGIGLMAIAGTALLGSGAGLLRLRHRQPRGRSL